MRRGRLRVFLGAAPGVGKSFAMLEEGHRLAVEGRDVVVGPLDPQGRSDVAELMQGLESIEAVPGGQWLQAVLNRRPEVVLIDDLAHNNPAGSPHTSRWDDVELILDEGIDVLTTLNIQNLESLNDVVFEITGVRETETIPDRVIRDHAEIEVVDLGEERIRERLKAGQIYPAERVDVVLANFFRPGNLSALRELTLSWAADRVDETLADYRFDHGIDETWETKERTVVGLPGSGGEAILRRAARTALRSRGDLIGVHVRNPGDEEPSAAADLTAERDLLESLGGTYYELVGDDPAETLLAFARAENASRIVLGAPRGSRSWRWWRPSLMQRIIGGAGAIEVSVVSYEPDSHNRVERRSPVHALARRRRLVACVLATVLLPLFTLGLLSLGPGVTLENVLLVYLLLAVTVGVVGGALPAVVTAVAGFLVANWFFTPPYRTWKISDVGHLFALFVFLVVASAVGLLVGNATKRSAEARKAREQAEALAATTTPMRSVGVGATSGMTSRIRDVFSMSAAAVLRRTPDGWEPIANVGISEILDPDDAEEAIPLTEDTVLALSGGSLTGDDRRVLRAFAAQMAQALDREQLETEAASVAAMTETDRLRTALLNAVSHDLRTPLATIKASVTSLLETEVEWTEEQTSAFLEVILGETEHLNRVVGRLLDASRIQVGAVHVFFVPVGLHEVVAAALAGLRTSEDSVVVEIVETLPPVQTDPALLERVLANLIENAVTWSPRGSPVLITAGEVSGRIDLRVIDRGPGIRSEERETVFQPFQRLGDDQGSSGVGLGMAVARGFLEAMGNQLSIEDTPGGGTTMVIGFKPAPVTESVVAAGLVGP